MTTNLTYDGLDPFEDPVDRLLAQIALELNQSRKRRRFRIVEPASP